MLSPGDTKEIENNLGDINAPTASPDSCWPVMAHALDRNVSSPRLVAVALSESSGNIPCWLDDSPATTVFTGIGHNVVPGAMDI